MKHMMKREAGQSIVIIVLALVALSAFAAIVVDAGMSYVQRREVQNASDSASMAGSVALAQKQSYGGIADTIDHYLRSNKVDPTAAGIKGWFVVQEASGNTHVCNGASDKPVYPKGQYPVDDRPPDKITCQSEGSALPLVGVSVDANKTSDTFFAGAFGIGQVQVKANSMGHVSGGVCSSSDVFPVALDINTFPVDPHTGLHVITFEQDNPTAPPYTLLENKRISDGHGGYSMVYNNIGYLTWDWPPSNGDTTAGGLVSNMNDVSRSGRVDVSNPADPSLPGSAGNMATLSVKDAVAARIGGDPVILPVYDNVPGYGSSAQYHIVGFASLKITDILVTGTGPGDDRKIIGKFQKWVDPQARGGCLDLGVAGVKENPPPTTQKRTLAGSVTFLPVVPNHIPQTIPTSADVVFVMDNSGSMSSAFGGGDSTTKIEAAKNAMTTFIGKLKIGNQTQGFSHQAGFVKFPQNFTNSSFTQTCYYYKGRYWDWPVQAQTYGNMTQRSALGTSFDVISSTIRALNPNGGTPMGQGLIAGREIVLGSGHNPNNVPVIILATDGMPNVTSSDGKSTGWYGSMSNTNVRLGTNPDGTATYPDCDKQAALDAYAAANTAKANGVLIFAIGTGGDFDPHVLQAIATPDSTGHRYYFTAGDSAALSAAYDSIARQMSDLGGTCAVSSKLPERAPSAQVTIKNLTTGAVLPPVYTLANGEFIVPDVTPGQYQITAATYNDPVTGLPYDTFTDGPGGIVISDPIIFVDTGLDTYRTDVFLKTQIDPCLP